MDCGNGVYLAQHVLSVLNASMTFRTYHTVSNQCGIDCHTICLSG